MDMAKFFDRVNHSKLIEILSRTVKDGRVISLVHKYLNAGVVVDHKFERTESGVPQGGPLSLLLSNIMLNELDKELHKRGTSLFATPTIVCHEAAQKMEEQRKAVAFRNRCTGIGFKPPYAALVKSHCSER